ncbi:hypothetical protein WA026_008256 [Henosepilachna vigintioctopunctata]|uniref:Secreted protein n=1 Tax=Henosepilachna vigintioctopunctata TaxID=420089 RepID=A0AAW1TKQ2_9CUCU
MCVLTMFVLMLIVQWKLFNSHNPFQDMNISNKGYYDSKFIQRTITRSKHSPTTMNCSFRPMRNTPNHRRRPRRLFHPNITYRLLSLRVYVDENKPPCRPLGVACKSAWRAGGGGAATDYYAACIITLPQSERLRSDGTRCIQPEGRQDA